MKVPATTAPKFSLGDVVKIDKLGLCAHDDPGPYASDYTICGIRFEPQIEEDDDGDPFLNYEDGWEYQLARVEPRTASKGFSITRWLTLPVRRRSS